MVMATIFSAPAGFTSILVTLRTEGAAIYLVSRIWNFSTCCITIQICAPTSLIDITALQIFQLYFIHFDRRFLALILIKWQIQLQSCTACTWQKQNGRSGRVNKGKTIHKILGLFFVAVFVEFTMTGNANSKCKSNKL